MQTHNSYGNCIYVQLKSISRLIALNRRSNTHMWPRNGHPREASHLQIFIFLDLHNSCTCHNSMVSRNSSTTEWWFGTKLQKRTEIFVFIFRIKLYFSKLKYGLFKDRFGALVQNNKARDAEINITWKCFLHIAEVYISLDCFDLITVQMLNFTSIRMAKKIIFLPFSFRSIFLLVENFKTEVWSEKNKWYHRFIHLYNAVPNHSLVVKPFIETTELRQYRDPKITSKR
jgi:hypothetical protein